MMRLNFDKFRSLFIIIITFGMVVCGYGCARTSHQKLADHEIVLLGEKPDFGELPAFLKMVEEEPGTVEFEKARIDYLLERLSQSSYQFIRNEEEYSNARAVIHIKWKYFRESKFIKTAENFIDFSASGSKTSGRPYLIRKGPKEYYLLKDILYDELGILDEGFVAYQASRRKQEELIEEAKESAESEINQDSE